ncbi:hypothetical protein BYT27DRAFT_7200676, partial [Phlegmacium glaucopus]
MQCKARRYEWLDPSIKRTEWSKTEDEKSLHLAKLMPTQWRTIAPIVAGLAGPSDDIGPSVDDIRRLRPGEIDPDPETKPARPDPIDMGEDDYFFLSLLLLVPNTQGKKAKRKARERQLEEARRLAVLQKKRELKSIGIIMRHKTKKKTWMYYNTDIPFEKKAVPGFYDTSEERSHVAAASKKRKRQRKNAAGKEGDDGPTHQTKFIAATASAQRDAQIQKLKGAELIGRRRKLVLPPAQVGEMELEDIIEIGQERTQKHCGRLISDYEGLETAQMARTPRTTPQLDNVMMEAQNLRRLTIAQTPLLGDENTPLHASPGGGFDGSHDVSGNVSATPLRTPLCDTLSIDSGDHSAPGDDLRDQQLYSAGFMNLPRPENNFELLVPDDDPGEGPIEEEELRLLARRLQAVQLGLPRPIIVDITALMQRLSPEVFDQDLAHAQELTGASESLSLEAAKVAIHAELSGLVGFPSSNAHQLHQAKAERKLGVILGGYQQHVVIVKGFKTPGGSGVRVRRVGVRVGI